MLRHQPLAHPTADERVADYLANGGGSTFVDEMGAEMLARHAGPLCARGLRQLSFFGIGILECK